MKEQSVYVFNRPEYIGEEYYVKPAKYICCNCGTRSVFSNLVQHAGECDVKEQIEDANKTSRDQYVSMGQAIEHFENECKVKLKKYDYTPPKRVKALWLGQTDGDVEYKDAYYLYIDNKYIGIGNGKKRFSLYYENGQEIGIIGTNCCALSDSDNYYIFETARDLYLWMAEGEE